MKRVESLILDHAEAQTIHRTLEGNLGHSANNQTAESFQFRDKIREIVGSGRHGTLEGPMLAFYDQHFGA